jgi:hypothetical protein
LARRATARVRREIDSVVLMICGPARSSVSADMARIADRQAFGAVLGLQGAADARILGLCGTPCSFRWRSTSPPTPVGAAGCTWDGFGASTSSSSWFGARSVVALSLAPARRPAAT